MIDDFIRIRGDTLDPAPFQGIGGGTTGGWSEIAITDTGEASTISASLWNAQTTAISKESDYLRQLDSLYKDRHRLLTENQSKFVDAMKEAVESVVGLWIGKWIVAAAAAAGIVTGVGTAVIVGAFVAEFLIGQAFNKLTALLSEGSKLAAAMIAENDILAAMSEEERSIDNYDRREAVMRRHIAQIDVLRQQIEDAEVHTAAAIEKAQTIDLSEITDAIKTAFIRDKSLLTEAGEFLFGEDENDAYMLDLRDALADLKYNDETVRVGDVEISTRGRYVNH